MNDGCTLSARDLWLSYPVYGVPQMTLRGMIADRLYWRGELAKPRTIAALKGISFKAHAGDRIALIGLNGAGKSTLLRLICDIYRPDSGLIERAGSVVPLLGSLPGVSADASGYENIKLSAYSMGLPREQLPELVAEVESFSELGDFLSLPIKTYSSGMVGRLFFAIMTSLSADIFAMDEFSFATGDASFKGRAKLRVRRLLDRAKTVFLATHDQQLVNNVCNKALYLSKGEMVAFGATQDVMQQYQADVAKAR